MTHTVMFHFAWLAIYALLGPSMVLAIPSNDDIPYHPLKLDDFKGTPDSASEHFAQTFTGTKFEWKGTTKEGGGGQFEATITDLKYQSFVDQEKSWWKDKNQDGEVLKHEQGHFDLSELKAKELNANKKTVMDTVKGQGATPQAALDDLKKKLDDLAGKEAKDLNATQDKYDTETEHGLNKEKQMEWNDKIDKGLKQNQKPAGSQAESKSKETVSTTTLSYY